MTERIPAEDILRLVFLDAEGRIIAEARGTNRASVIQQGSVHRIELVTRHHGFSSVPWSIGEDGRSEPSRLLFPGDQIIIRSWHRDALVSGILGASIH